MHVCLCSAAQNYMFGRISVRTNNECAAFLTSVHFSSSGANSDGNVSTTQCAATFGQIDSAAISKGGTSMACPICAGMPPDDISVCVMTCLGLALILFTLDTSVCVITPLMLSTLDASVCVMTALMLLTPLISTRDVPL